MKALIYKGPKQGKQQNKRYLYRLPTKGGEEIVFRSWGEPVEVSDAIARELLASKTHTFAIVSEDGA